MSITILSMTILSMIDSPRWHAALQPPNRLAQTLSRLIPRWNHEPGSRLTPRWTRLEYTDQGQDYYEERYRERVLRQLSQRAQKMGMKLVVAEQVV